MTLIARRSSGCLVAGAFVEPASGEWLERRAPSDVRHVVTTFRDGRALVDDAVGAASEAGLPWRSLPLEARAATLRAFADALAEIEGLLVHAVVSEIGKPVTEAEAEVRSLGAKIAQQLPLAAQELARVELPDATGFFDWQPHGVFVVIGPFNFPLSLSHGHIVPALLAGNTVVLKPSESAPLCAELYASAWRHAATATGAPGGALGLVHGRGDVGAALTTHPGVHGVAFTGSYDVGTRILAANARSPGRMIALELGGKNAALVLDDADPQHAAREIARGAFETTGQRCTATSRVLVHSSLWDRFVAALLDEAGAWVPGDPLDPRVRMGPLATEPAWRRFVDAQERAGREGLRTLLTGGVCDWLGAPGWWVLPAIHEVSDPEAAAGRWREELFGPELLLQRVGDDDAAVAMACASDYGLAASVFTSSTTRFEALRPRLRCGLVNHNRRTSGADGRLPFGGVGHSGNHRPAGALALRYCAYPVATLRG